MKTLLTGSSRGIGESIAELLLDNGYEVIGVSTSPNNQSTKNYTHKVCDLSKDQEVEKLKEIFLKEKVPEVLINNEGIFMEAQFEDSDKDWMAKWDRTQQVNLRSVASKVHKGKQEFPVGAPKQNLGTRSKNHLTG
ncbi:MAG: SDR family oxidoreductase [Balneola sp.]